MKTNPFKFGSVVDGAYFTDREEEIERISSFINSANHLLLVSPRRFGKTSLIKKVLEASGRKYVYLDLQLILSPSDFAAQLLKRVYRTFPAQKIKRFIKSFRIIPTLVINPVTGETEISFRTGTKEAAPLEDTLNLIEKLGTESNRIIVVLDEFQDIFRIEPGLDRKLRSIIQVHKNINYIFLGSSESVIRGIFEKKNSPFYHFASLMILRKIPAGHFTSFLEEKFKTITPLFSEISKEVIDFTSCHPYYTQQLAFTVWETLSRSRSCPDVVKKSISEILMSHDNDYERLWNTLNGTDMKVLAGMSEKEISPLSSEFSQLFGTVATSTIFSTLKRLAVKGILIKDEAGYHFDDPFFREWIVERRRR